MATAPVSAAHTRKGKIIYGFLVGFLAILIRGVEGIAGPGKIGQQLKLNKSFYGENLENSNRIWVEDDGMLCNYTLHPRINVEYAGDIWKNKLYRYKIEKAKL